MRPFKYEQIAEDIRRMVISGIIAPGEKLPSLRKISRERGVSISTAMQAYMALEEENIAGASPKSGFFARAVPARLDTPAPMPPAKTAPFLSPGKFLLEISSAAPSEMRVFSAGSPAPELLPNRAMAKAAAQALRAEDLNARYGPPCGLFQLRQIIAARLSCTGIKCGADDIIISSGASEGLSIAVRAAAEPGDTVAVETPGYTGFFKILENTGMKILPIPVIPSAGPDLDYLKKAAGRYRIKAFMTAPNFSNPSGSLMSDGHKAALAGLCAAKGITIIEDDVYGDLHFSESRPAPLPSFGTGADIIYVSSFSKTLGPGLRVGFILPGKLRDRAVEAKIAGTMSSVPLTQAIVQKMISGGGYDRHLRHLRTVYSRNLGLLYSLFAHYLPKGTRISEPKGSFYLWVELPKRINAGKLARLALKEKMLLIPGNVFSPSGEYGNYFRAGAAKIFSREEAEASVQRLSELAKQ